jgi:hypothetical protein
MVVVFVVPTHFFPKFWPKLCHSDGAKRVDGVSGKNKVLPPFRNIRCFSFVKKCI